MSNKTKRWLNWTPHQFAIAAARCKDFEPTVVGAWNLRNWWKARHDPFAHAYEDQHAPDINATRANEAWLRAFMATAGECFRGA